MTPAKRVAQIVAVVALSTGAVGALLSGHLGPLIWAALLAGAFITST